MREKPLKWRMLAALGRGVNIAVRLPFIPMGKRREAIAVSTIMEQMSYAYSAELPDGRALQFFSPGYKPAIRGITLFTKQPEVPIWIDTFSPGDVLWDVGANVGTYSLYAASREGVQVLAFEPEASNYFVLTRNVALNGMWDRIKTYCMALSDETSLSELSLFHTAIGGSKHAFGDPEESWEEDDPIVFQQGMIGFSIDGLIEQFGCPVPNHIKIDVDGIEEKIIAGARKTLRNPKLQSILLELQAHKPEEADAMKADLVDAGFSLDVDAGANVIYRRSISALADDTGAVD